MLAAAGLGSLAAVIAPSNDTRMLSRLVCCLCQGCEWRGMQGWPGEEKQSSVGVLGGAWDVSAETLHLAVLPRGLFLFTENYPRQEDFRQCYSSWQR